MARDKLTRTGRSGTGGRLAGLAGLGLVLVTAAGCTASVASPPVSSPAPSVSSATRTTDPTPASTPVPAPTPGKVTATEKSRTIPRHRAVALDHGDAPAEGLTVELTSVKAITAKASGPGEVAGPALQVDVHVRNTGTSAVDLSQAVVNLTDEKGAPGSAMSQPPAAPLPTSVAAGKDATGVYVFTVPRGRRQPVTIEVSLSPSVAVSVFRGSR